MGFHYCPRCNYSSKRKSSLEDHFKRKKICPIKFKDVSQNECLKLLDEKGLNVNNSEEMCKLLELENKLLKEQLKNNTNSVTNNTINNNIQGNQININIHSYKDTDYTVVEKALNECIKKNGELTMGKLIDIIHFNEKFPQNMNVYIANSKTKRIMKFDGEKFNEEGRGDKGIEDIFNEKLSDIEEHPTLNDDLKFSSDGTWIQFNTKSEIEKKEVLDEMYKSLFNKRERILKRMKERETKLLKPI
jgi:hypothetical protein